MQTQEHTCVRVHARNLTLETTPTAQLPQTALYCGEKLRRVYETNHVWHGMVDVCGGEMHDTKELGGVKRWHSDKVGQSARGYGMMQ